MGEKLIIWFQMKYNDPLSKQPALSPLSANKPPNFTFLPPPICSTLWRVAKASSTCPNRTWLQIRFYPHPVPPKDQVKQLILHVNRDRCKGNSGARSLPTSRPGPRSSRAGGVGVGTPNHTDSPLGRHSSSRPPGELRSTPFSKDIQANLSWFPYSSYTLVFNSSCSLESLGCSLQDQPPQGRWKTPILSHPAGGTSQAWPEHTQGGWGALYNYIQKGCVRPPPLSSPGALPIAGTHPTPPEGPPPMGPHPGGSRRLGGTNWLPAAASSRKFQLEQGRLEP